MKIEVTEQKLAREFLVFVHQLLVDNGKNPEQRIADALEVVTEADRLLKQWTEEILDPNPLAQTYKPGTCYRILSGHGAN